MSTDDRDIKGQEHAIVEGHNALFSCESAVFALDVSGSMEHGRKIHTLREAFRKYISKKMASPTATTDQVSMVVFPNPDRSAEAAEVEVTSTFEGHEAPEPGMVGMQNSVDPIADFLGTPKPRTFRRVGNELDCKTVFELTKADPRLCSWFERIHPTGGTPMGDALEKAYAILDRGAVGLARVIVMGDGDCNEGKYGHEEDALVNLVANAKNVGGIITDAVWIGIQGSGMDLQGKELLKKVAVAGGGQFVEIASLEDFERYLGGVEEERRKLIGRGTLLLPGS